MSAGRRRRRLELDEGESIAQRSDGDDAVIACENKQAADEIRHRRRQPKGPRQGEDEDKESADDEIATAIHTDPSLPQSPSAEVVVPSAAPSLTRPIAGRHRDRVFLPNPKIDLLPVDERLLLETPIHLDRTDIYPSRAEPHFLIEPPAPSIGDVTSSYVEFPGVGSQFKRKVSNAGAGGRPAANGAPARLAESVQREAAIVAYYAPTGATQAVMLLVGLFIHLSQGALAGVCLLQLAIAPWPDKADDLYIPAAYAAMAVPLQQ